VLLVCVALGLMAILIRLALLPVLPIPNPIVQDEFSYLLGADTFAHGRVTNPPHPLWVHFETLHENMQPTYCSIYPPAQAVFLALGQVVLGNPWYGVVLSMGLMFAAICWMLHGWVAPRYAVTATIICILCWGLTGQWINSYWGGTVAAAAGALVIGAIPRLARQPAPAVAATAAIGLIVLANSRPFEGALAAIAAAIVLWREVRRLKRPLASLFTRGAIAALAAILIPGAAAMAYYNYRTTGNALLFAHDSYTHTYEASPYFYMLPDHPPPQYRHDHIRRYWLEWVRAQYTEARSNPAKAISVSAGFMWDFYFYTPIGLAMLAGLLFARNHTVGAALALAALPILGAMCGVRALPHYIAPICGAFVMIAAAGLQSVGQWTPGGRPIGPLLVMALCGVAFAAGARETAVQALLAKHPPNTLGLRPVVIDRLRQMGGKHLVIVHYTPKHSVHEEWVYNAADIDGSDIVWAQDMGDRNRELFDYYRDRKAWVIQPDIDPLAVQPYGLQ